MKLYKLFSEGDIGEDLVVFPSKEEALEWGWQRWAEEFESGEALLEYYGIEVKEDFIDETLSVMEIELVGVLPR